MSPSFSSNRRPGATSLLRELRGTLRLPAGGARNSYRVSLSEDRHHATATTATQSTSAGGSDAATGDTSRTPEHAATGGSIEQQQQQHLQITGLKEKRLPENGHHGIASAATEPSSPQQHHYQQHLQTHLNQEISANQNGLSNRVSVNSYYQI